MLHKICKALFKFSTSQNGFIKNERAAIGLLCIYELQIASFFAVEVQGSSFDSPLTYLIALTNIFAPFGTTYGSAKFLLIAFTVYYAFSLAVDLLGIFGLIRNNSTGSNWLQKLSSTLFVIQKYLLLIPSLIACSSALVSAYLVLKIIGAVLLGFVCIYNLSHSMSKISLPYNKDPFTNLSSEEETVEFAVLVLTAFVSSNYIQTRSILSGYHLNQSGSVSLGVSLPFLILSLIRIMKLMTLPTMNNKIYQTIHVIFSFSSFYTLIELILSGRGVVSRFPVLIITSLLIKVILNGREVLLVKLYTTLQKPFLNRSIFFQLVALRSLYSCFESTTTQYEDLIKIIQVLIAESSNQEIFASNHNEPLEVCEAKIKSDLRPQLIKFIENYYSRLIRTIDPDASFTARIAYIQFLSEVSGNKPKAIQRFFEARRVLRERLSLKKNFIFKTIQKQLMTSFQDKFHLREVLEIQRSHQDCVVRTQELVSIRTEILSRLLGPGCDLDMLKKLSIDFSTKGEKLVNDIKKNIKSDCSHLETVALFDYIQLCLYEMSLGSRTLKLQEALSKVKAFNLNDLDEEVYQIPEKKILTNIDNRSRLSYIAFSLSSTKLGEAIVCSNSFRTLLGLSNHIMASEIKIENIFPSYFKEKILSLISEASERGKTFENNKWAKSFLQKLDGSLIEIKGFMSIEVLQNEEIALVLYIYKLSNPLNGFLLDEALKPIGFSESLRKSVAAATKTSEAETSASLLQFLNSRQFLPVFDPSSIARDDFIDLDIEYHFETKSEANSISPKRKNRTHNSRTLFLNATISKNHLEMFNSEHFTVTINQIAKRSNKLTAATSESPLLNLNKLKLENTLPSPLHISLNNQDIPESTPIHRVSTMKLGGRSSSKENDSLSNSEDKIDQKFQNNRLENSEKNAALEDIEPAASSQLSSSRLTNRRKKIKQLISSLDLPHYLVGVNIFGHLSVVGLVVMTIVSYVVFSQAYNQFAQFAQVAPFPYYLNTVVKAIIPNVEQLVAVNLNYYSTSNAVYLQKSSAAAFTDKVQRFMAEYNQFMVDYNVEALSPHFKYSEFEISVSRQGIFDTPQNISIYEASNIFLGVIYKLNKTAFSNFNANLSEVIWIRQYTLTYYNAYEDMRLTLFSDFNLRYQSILQLFDIILAIGAIVTLIIVVTFAIVLRSTERRKSQLMVQILTIPHHLINSYLNIFQSEYKEFFGTGINNKNFQLPTQAKAKEKSHHKNNKKSTSSMLYQKKETSIFLILVVSIAPILYVMAYYVIANIYFKYKTTEAIPYIDSIDMQSKEAPLTGATTGLLFQLENTYNSSAGEALIPIVTQYFDYFKTFRDDYVNLMETVSSTLLATDDASEALKQRYANVSTILACNDIITNPNYQTCLTAFNGAAKNGLGAMVNALYDYLYLVEQTFLASPTVATILQLCNSTEVKERLALSVAIDPIILTDIQTEGTNLAGIMQGFQNSLDILLAVGILQMTSLLFLIWRPINRRMTEQYLDCKRVYAVLPVQLIAENRHILQVLKLQSSSQWF